MYDQVRVYFILRSNCLAYFFCYDRITTFHFAFLTFHLCDEMKYLFCMTGTILCKKSNFITLPLVICVPSVLYLAGFPIRN